MQSIETAPCTWRIINMRRISSFFCSTTYPISEAAGKLRKSRLRSSKSTGIFPAR